MTGYEVNRSWWEGNHSIPHFINISIDMAHPANVSIKHISEYVDELEDKSCIIPSDNALMFCYFNSLHYFHKYLQAYSGKIESTVDLKCMLI